ncbi:MAG: hypothetical protein EBR33_08445 [Synechococcaceae bacterium WB4_1_0192]|nr:hypothetical protein [Synechococcaceae bacterium WB4_1_0192]
MISRVFAHYMQPRGVLAQYDAGEDRYTLWADVQYPHRVRNALAENIFKIPEHHIRVIAHDVGGGFGTKGWQYPEHRLMPWAARKIGRPVKWTCERSEAILADEHARDERHAVRFECVRDCDADKNERDGGERRDEQVLRQQETALDGQVIGAVRLVDLLAERFDHVETEHEQRESADDERGRGAAPHGHQADRHQHQGRPRLGGLQQPRHIQHPAAEGGEAAAEADAEAEHQGRAPGNRPGQEAQHKGTQQVHDQVGDRLAPHRRRELHRCLPAQQGSRGGTHSHQQQLAQLKAQTTIGQQRHRFRHPATDPASPPANRQPPNPAATPGTDAWHRPARPGAPPH